MFTKDGGTYMGLFSGLEKFGLGSIDVGNIYEEEEKKVVENVKKPSVVKKKGLEELREEDYLLKKAVHCPICDFDFKTKAVKSSKARRVGADRDLRPRYKGIDTLKYDVSSCPKCGYTAMSRYFSHLSTIQMKMIKDNVCSKFKPGNSEEPIVYSYDEALDRYKLSLLCTVVKKGKISERAYSCLKMSWLCRGKAEEMLEKGCTPDSAELKAVKKEEMEYYEQAYEGLEKAVATESFPICGMDQNTMDMLLAEMAFGLGKYETASKLVSRLLISETATSKIKDKARDLKEDIIQQLTKKIKK